MFQETKGEGGTRHQVCAQCKFQKRFQLRLLNYSLSVLSEDHGCDVIASCIVYTALIYCYIRRLTYKMTS